MKSELVRVNFRKNDKSEKAQDNNGLRLNQRKLYEGKPKVNIKAKEKGAF